MTKNIPWPANSGEKQRTLGMVRALRAVGDVTVVGFVGEFDDPAPAAAEGVRVRCVHGPRARGAPRLALRALRRRSITAAKWWDAQLRSEITQELARGYDVVVIEHVQLADYLPRSLPPRVVSVLDMHNIESLLTSRLARTTRSWRRLPMAVEARALRRLERRCAPRFDVVSVVSSVDVGALRDVVGHPCVMVVPNAYSGAGSLLPPAPRPTACFVGLLSWAPNADAALAFTRDVWPAVRAGVPGARLLLVGREPTEAVRRLADIDIVVTGTVEDLRPWYEQSRVALAPLLAGGGSRLKIMEALSSGRPVVATSVGVEGLEDLVGRGVVVADDPATMAAELIRLLSDPSLATALGEQGAAAVRDDHSWESATSSLIEHLEVLHATL
ncbi:MAG: glycosyltransferase family 4 protein [Nocardioides sp.]|nr:glycosyltransferase family 4 protein [Nocardioides sp.]